jgi:hypothetical protein
MCELVFKNCSADFFFVSVRIVKFCRTSQNSTSSKKEKEDQFIKTVPYSKPGRVLYKHNSLRKRCVDSGRQ